MLFLCTPALVAETHNTARRWHWQLVAKLQCDSERSIRSYTTIEPATNLMTQNALLNEKIAPHT